MCGVVAMLLLGGTGLLHTGSGNPRNLTVQCELSPQWLTSDPDPAIVVLLCTLISTLFKSLSSDKVFPFTVKCVSSPRPNSKQEEAIM